MRVNVGRPRRNLLVALALAVTGAAVLLAAAGYSAARAAQELQQTRAALSGLRVETTASAEDRARGLDRAQESLARAERHLDVLPARLVAAVPVIGRSLRAEAVVVDAGQATVSAVQVAVAGASEFRTSDGAVDLQALQDYGRELDDASSRAEQALQVLRGTSTALTPPPVRRAVESADAALTPAVVGLRDGVNGVEVLAGLLGADGERQVLVALQNNAELRGTGGYVSTFATGVVADGRIRLEPFRDVLDVAVPPAQAQRVPAPPDFVEDFGPFLADTTLWRNWTMSPDIPASASVGAAAAGELLGVQPDVVLLLDVPAMAAVVRVSGEQPTLPDGSRLSADELADGLFVDAYARAGSSVADQDARRAALRAAADQAVVSLLAGNGLDELEVVRLLRELSRGRHVALWSARPQEQATLSRLGVAGSLSTPGDDVTHVSVNNLSANKLDYYVDRSVDVEVTLGRDGAEVLERVRLVNRAPDGLVPYVAGNERPGVLRERVEMSVSPRATGVSLTSGGAAVPGQVRTGSDRTRVATFVEMARGQSVDLLLRYTVPCIGLDYRLDLVPQPLAREAQLRVALRAGDGERLASVEGASLVDGAVDETSAWSTRRVLEAQLAGPAPRGLLRRVKDFWNSPVELG